MPDFSAEYLRRRLLQRVRIGQRYQLGADVLDELDIEIEPLLDILMLRMSTYVWTEKLAEESQEVTHEVPATWFQHLKQDHAPAWVLRRWPVRMSAITTVVRFTRSAAYPGADIKIPSPLGAPVLWEDVHYDGPYGP